MNRFEAEVRARGMTVFAHIDHAAGAAAVGLPLRPTELLIFGNAKTGTPLMQSTQMSGIDLPLKALVWQDASGTAWLSYNDPAFIARRHGLERRGQHDTQRHGSRIGSDCKQGNNATVSTVLLTEPTPNFGARR